MSFERASGILLHPTSLPGAYGIGDIGPQARAFADTLVAMGQRIWQVLPLGPTSYGDSPYQSPSTFAGNHLLISFDDLVEEGLLSRRKLQNYPDFGSDRVDYGPVIEARMDILHSVCRTFSRRAADDVKQAFERYCADNAYWLDDYALFMAIKDAHGGEPWCTWEIELIQRQPQAMKEARRRFATAMNHVQIMQFLFDRQWHRLRRYCSERGIRIIGDIPIFVAHDSADVWAHPDLFYVDDRGNLLVQAGVPPDYFSATGQLWGNPLYRWEVHRERGYSWWAARLKKIFELVDIVRIDHFRGFEQYWEVPADAETAINGHWVDGPKSDLFYRLIEQMGELPIIAEDLGVITPEVEALRDEFNFPGMRILQFAFGTDPKAQDYRPHNIKENCIVYTGTHDNDTTVGWFHSEAGEDSTRTAEEIEAERRTVLEYVHTDGSQIHWDMISQACHAPAHTAIYPLQDVLGLGSDARMNQPGKPDGNWQWRFRWDMLTDDIKIRLRDIAHSGGRCGCFGQNN